MLFPAVVLMSSCSTLAPQRYLYLPGESFLGKCVWLWQPLCALFELLSGSLPPCTWVHLQGLGASGAVMVPGPKGRAGLSRQKHAAALEDASARMLLEPSQMQSIQCSLESPCGVTPSPAQPRGIQEALREASCSSGGAAPPSGPLPFLGSSVSLLPLLW